MHQTGNRLSALCSHSNGEVRSFDASGIANGESFILTVPWDNGKKSEYAGRLKAKESTHARAGVLAGSMRDLVYPNIAATWEVKDKIFLRP